MTRIYVKIAIISHWNDFSWIPLGKCISWRTTNRCKKKKKKKSNFDIFEMYEIWECMTLSRNPMKNGLLSPQIESSWRAAKHEIKYRKNVLLYGYILKSIFASSDSFCFILSHVLCGTKIKIHCVWIVNNMHIFCEGDKDEVKTIHITKSKLKVR